MQEQTKSIKIQNGKYYTLHNQDGWMELFVFNVSLNNEMMER